MKKFACWCIWTFAEFWGIKLGRFAPYVFGGMIGSKPKKK